ncbi:CD1375 family protein [Metabacillus idriensis]|nr:CD1375 family protein [Metabacillus idriensis]
MLAMLFATYIMKGKWSYSDVPEPFRPQVKEILVDEGLGHLTEEGI